MVPHRRPAFFPFTMFAIGLGLCFWYGQKWYALPSYSEHDIAASVELNLAVDLHRRGAALQPDTQGLERLREQVRTEVVADIEHERKEIQTGLGVGLIALVLSAGAFLFSRLNRAPGS